MRKFVACLYYLKFHLFSYRNGMKSETANFKEYDTKAYTQTHIARARECVCARALLQ